MNHSHQTAAPSQGGAVSPAPRKDLVMVGVSIGGEEFITTFEVPDMKGSIMATDLNARWLEKQFADMLRQRFGRVHPCSS